MKKAFLTILPFVTAFACVACPVCERQQPKVFRGIAHGAGPTNNWDYVIVWSIVAVTVLTLFYSAKWLIRPGEKSSNHIKRHILNYDQHEG